MKIFKAIKVFLKKLIMKIISAFKKEKKKSTVADCIREKYVIVNGKRFLGYVTSKQKSFGILCYDFTTNPKRRVWFDTREEAFKFMVEEYRSAFNKMWNIDSMFRYPINGYNQAQGLHLIRYHIKQLNNSKLDTILVASVNERNRDFDGDSLSVCSIK